MNLWIEKENNNEIREVTPAQLDDSHVDEADASRIITIPHDPTYYDPELATLVAKYHKMEKHTPKLFSDVELVQGPLHLISSILNQENTIKNESSKLIGSGSSSNPISEIFKSSQKHQKGFKSIPESKIIEEMSLIEIERFDLIEERVQFMLEYLISKGTCSFLEQNESKNIVIKKLVKSLKVLKEKQRVPKDEENKNAQSNVGMFISSCKHIFDEIFKQSYFVKIQSWKESNTFDSFESNDENTLAKGLSTKLQFLNDILEINMNVELKQQKENHMLKSEGAKLIYEILIGKSFEIDAFEMKDPEVQKLRSEHASSESLAKKPDAKFKEKAFINIFKPPENTNEKINTINIKKIPTKSIKKVNITAKSNTKKGNDLQGLHNSSTGGFMINDEGSLLSLNHTINYHYLLCQTSFNLRGLLTLTEDSLFSFTSYKLEELEYQKHQICIMKFIKEKLESNLFSITERYNQAEQNADQKFLSIQVSDDNYEKKLTWFMNSRLVSLGFISVREYQRCLDGSFKMLQCEPEERNEVDIAIKKITREMQKGFNHFLDMLDIGDDHDFSESSNKNAQSGLHGAERINAYYQEKQEMENLNICSKLAEMNYHTTLYHYLLCYFKCKIIFLFDIFNFYFPFINICINIYLQKNTKHFLIAVEFFKCLNILSDINKKYYSICIFSIILERC